MPVPPEIDYDHVRSVLERAVARACPPSLAAHRADIVQNALLRILDLARRGEAGGVRRSSYLWQVACTVTIDEIRRVGRRREVALEVDGAVNPAAARVPSSSAERGVGLRRELRDCLQRLHESRRLAASLYLFGFRAEEAAKVLRWSLKRVRNATFRGLTDLRRCLERKGIRP